MGRIVALWIGDDRVRFVPLGLPGFEWLSDEIDRLARSLPIAVVAANVLHPVPAARQQFATVPVNDVAFHGERQVFFDTRCLQLMQFAESQDIVADVD